MNGPERSKCVFQQPAINITENLLCFTLFSCYAAVYISSPSKNDIDHGRRFFVIYFTTAVYCSGLTRLPQLRGTAGTHVYTTCIRGTIPQAWADVSPVEVLTVCYSTCMRVDPHVYPCIITLYRGYCVQYSNYAGTPVFITVF